MYTIYLMLIFIKKEKVLRYANEVFLSNDRFFLFLFFFATTKNNAIKQYDVKMKIELV